MPSLSLSTHPQLQLSNPFRVKIPASETQTQQSLTVTVPATHYYVQIVPHLPVAQTTRPYRVFVLVNGHRQSEVVKPGAERDKQRPLFEAPARARLCQPRRGRGTRGPREEERSRQRGGRAGEVHRLHARPAVVRAACPVNFPFCRRHSALGVVPLRSWKESMGLAFIWTGIAASEPHMPFEKPIFGEQRDQDGTCGGYQSKLLGVGNMPAGGAGMSGPSNGTGMARPMFQQRPYRVAAM